MTERQIKKIKTLINEKIFDVWRAEHDSSGHHYRHKYTNILHDSVTTKLQILNKPHLLKWAIRKGIEWLEYEERWSRLSGYDREELLAGAQSAYTDIRDDAGSVGTQAHDAIERYILDWIHTGKRVDDIKVYFKPESDPRAIASARGIEALFKKKNIIPLASEILVGHPKYSAGTLDFLCFWDGVLTMVDFKTSNQVDKNNYSMQVSAYIKFFTYMTKIRVPQAKIIHLNKNSNKYDVYRVVDINGAWKAFKAVCALYDWINSRHDKCEKDINKIVI